MNWLFCTTGWRRGNDRKEDKQEEENDRKGDK
jgi:hypothetical protein